MEKCSDLIFLTDLTSFGPRHLQRPYSAKVTGVMQQSRTLQPGGKHLFWLSSRNFFQGGKIYCYANFYCYAIVFGPNFREGQKFSGGRPPAPPCGRKPVFSCMILTKSGINYLYSILKGFYLFSKI